MKLVAATLLAGMLGAAALHAAETEKLFDGTGATEWSTLRDDVRLDQELSLSELKPVADPPALLWRFASKGVGFNDIFLMRPIERRFEAIRVRVKNEGAAFELACKIQAVDHAEWTAKRVALAAGEDWRWVEFPLADWAVASWSRDADGHASHHVMRSSR